MADSVQISDKWKVHDTTPSVTNFNLLDISTPHKKDGNEVPQPKVQGPVADVPDAEKVAPSAPPNGDAETNRLLGKSSSYDVKFDPNAWQSKPFDQIYNHGMIDILSNPEKKERFGVRISSDPDDQNRISPLHGYKLRDRSSLSLEYQIKF